MGETGFFLFGHFVTYYGMMIVAGIIVNIPLAYVQITRFQLNMDDFLTICGFSALYSIIGAKILYLLVSYNQIDFTKLKQLSYFSSLMNGGFVFLGGIIGFLLALIFCKKVLHISVQPYIQACIGCLPIGHGFGRIGCFLVGCCYGIPYTGPFSVTYIHSTIAPRGIPLFPVQLIEALIEFLLGLFLVIFCQRLKGKTGIYIYLSVYSISRFFLEFLRYDSLRGKVANISTSQLISILLLSLSLFSLIKGYLKYEYHKSTNQ